MSFELKYRALDKDEEDISLPLSKSILNRYQIISFLSGKNFMIDKESLPVDNRILAEQLDLIKNSIGKGCKLDVGDSGTAMRFLISLLCIVPGDWVLDGSARIRQRPVLHLVEQLRAMGAKIEYMNKDGFLPLEIIHSGLCSVEAKLPGNISSQYISSLMLIAPLLNDGLIIHIAEDQVSMPYIQMSCGLMRYTGADVEINNEKIEIRRSGYKNALPEIEKDWSAASYFYLIASLIPGKRIRLERLSVDSFQGDSVCMSLFKLFGVTSFCDGKDIIIQRTENPVKEIDIDLKGFPDLAPSMIAASAALDIPSVYRGLHHLKFKESDRLAVMKNELGKMGFAIDSNEGTFIVNKKTDNLKAIEICTNNDHRIAMALSPLSILIPGLSTDNKECICKSYPGFLQDIENVGILIR